MNVKEVKFNDKIVEIIVSSENQEISLLNKGATFIKWITSSGKDIIARYQNMEEFVGNGMYLGATVGPNAGRLEDGHYFLGGKEYQMEEKKMHFLHSGDYGFSSQIFDYEIDNSLPQETKVIFKLAYQHPLVTVKLDVLTTYVIKEDEVRVLFDVKSDGLALCNMTNHAYFNIDGDFTKALDTHEFLIPSDKVLMMDDTLMGTEFMNVENTPFDFRKKKAILPAIIEVEKSDKAAFGIDHYFLFQEATNQKITVTSTKSDDIFTVESTAPGAVVYTCNYPSEEAVQTGKPLALHATFCIEPQYVGNAVNRQDCQVGLVDVNQPYHEEIIYTWGKR